jgi:hypothetical protein
MKIYTLILLTSLSLPAMATELTAAVQKLGQAQSYAWQANVSLKGGPSKSPPPLNGSCDQAKGCFITQVIDGKTVQAIKTSTTALANAGSGWKPSSSFTDGSETNISVREMTAFERPHAELRLLVGGITDVKSLPDGSFIGNISPSQGQTLASEGMKSRAPSAVVKAMKCKGGTLQVWLTAGLPTKYALTLDVSLALGFMKLDIRRTNTVTLTGVNSTKVIIPAEAQSALR